MWALGPLQEDIAASHKAGDLPLDVLDPDGAGVDEREHE
jgi:hypothetical protein